MLNSKEDAANIRPALPADAPAAADLIYLPKGRLADYLYGSDDPARARHVMAELFQLKKNRFSHEFCDVLEFCGQVVGLLLGYPSDILPSFDLPMAAQLREVLGWPGMFRLLKRCLPLIRKKEVDPGEYYIFNLAVSPDFQSQGFGTRLLAHAEQKALALGLKKCSLGLTVSNQRARALYERLGYQIVETIHSPSLEKAIDFPGYYRMVKLLAKESL
jgi:ribosomal protein S18 acetylase RimI-like enzyme